MASVKKPWIAIKRKKNVEKKIGKAKQDLVLAEVAGMTMS